MNEERNIMFDFVIRIDRMFKIASAITQPPEIASTPMGNALRDFPPISNGKPVTVAVYSLPIKQAEETSRQYRQPE